MSFLQIVELNEEAARDQGTYIPEHVGEIYLTFVLIKNVHLVGKKVVYIDTRNAWNGQVQNNKLPCHRILISENSKIKSQLKAAINQLRLQNSQNSL